MFTIYGGKTEFNQWEQGQMVTNPSMAVGDKVRFWNSSGETHPMIAYKHDGVVVADVPNDLLKRASPILVDLCRDSEHLTRFTVNFVSHREPEGYKFIDNTHCEPVVPSGGGGATSWNDLEDKPFGKTIDSLKVIVPESEMTGVYNEGQYTAGIDVSLFSEEPDNLLIVFDGTEYLLDKYSFQGMAIYGNLSVLDGFGPDTGEPFVFGLALGGNIASMLLLDADTHMVGISKVLLSTQKLSHEFVGTSFYVSVQEDDYLYTDIALTKKATEEDIIKATEDGFCRICSVFPGVPVVFFVYSPLYVQYDDLSYHPAAVVLSGLSNDQPVFRRYYTAEYTGE